MDDKIIVAIISAGLAALVNSIFQIVNKIIDNRKEENTSRLAERKEYLRKKEDAYIAAIQRLIEIKEGFNYSRAELLHMPKKIKQIEDSNQTYLNIAPLIRLYATDEIYNWYQKLAKFSQYAFSDSRRLFEDSKEYYNISISILSRLMQDDLGYRKFNEVKEIITCPECGMEHDLFSKCPKCGMAYSDLQIKMEDIYKEMQEFNNSQKEENNDI